MLAPLILVVLVAGAPRLTVPTTHETLALAEGEYRRLLPGAELVVDVGGVLAGEELVVDLVRLQAPGTADEPGTLSVAVGGRRLRLPPLKERVVDDRRTSDLLASWAVRHRFALPPGSS